MSHSHVAHRILSRGSADLEGHVVGKGQLSNFDGTDYCNMRVMTRAFPHAIAMDRVFEQVLVSNRRLLGAAVEMTLNYIQPHATK